MQIQDAVADVTGGQGGIGKAVVDALLATGAATVYATARVPEPSRDRRVVPVQLEVTDSESVGALAALASDANIVVNNAGILEAIGLLDGTIGDLGTTIDTNVAGPIRITHAFAPILESNGGGAVANMHSVMSWLPAAGIYGVSKAALWSATNSLRNELAPSGTLVVGVHAGWVDTEMAHDVQAPKVPPSLVADAIVRAIENDEPEVLVDELTQRVKAHLCGPVTGLSLALNAADPSGIRGTADSQTHRAG